MAAKGKFFKYIIILFVMFSIIWPGEMASAETVSANQNFNQKVTMDLNKYLKKAGGTITLKYYDFVTGDQYQLRGKTSSRAASTIKLPLVLYIMEQASKGKINLNKKLTYHRSQYNGGSGVIQYQKVGTKYTIGDLVKKAMIHSDNIAFVMLRDWVGRPHFYSYMKSLGAKNIYPGGVNMTSANDLIIYAKELNRFSQNSKLGKEIVEYLKRTDYNTTIPRGIKGAKVAHKVGMIPESRIYNDVGIIYDKEPFALAIMTKNISYKKSQKVIADLAGIVYKDHKAKGSAKYFACKSDVTIYQNGSTKTKIGLLKKGEIFKVVKDLGLGYNIQFGKATAYVQKESLLALITPTQVNFSNGVQKTGIIKIAQNAIVLNKATTGKAIGIMNKNQESYYSRIDHDFYVIDLGGRIGFVDKKYVIVQGPAK